MLTLMATGSSLTKIGSPMLYLENVEMRLLLFPDGRQNVSTMTATFTDLDVCLKLTRSQKYSSRSSQPHRQHAQTKRPGSIQQNQEMRSHSIPHNVQIPYQVTSQSLRPFSKKKERKKERKKESLIYPTYIRVNFNTSFCVCLLEKTLFKLPIHTLLPSLIPLPSRFDSDDIPPFP